MTIINIITKALVKMGSLIVSEDGDIANIPMCADKKFFMAFLRMQPLQWSQQHTARLRCESQTSNKK
jgi:hypothetical protein